jgi:hypothetical protein
MRKLVPAGAATLQRDDEIRRLEASMRRMDAMDPDEIEPGEYGRIMDRLVKLREDRDSKPKSK